MRRKDRFVTMAVHPLFKNYLKTEASRNGKKLIDFTREIAEKKSDKKEKRFTDINDYWSKIL